MNTFEQAIATTLPDVFDQHIGANKLQVATSSQLPSDVIPEGERDNRLASIAGSLRRQGLSAEAIATALHGINEQSCRPPLPPADIDRIAKSIGGKPAGFDSAHPRVGVRAESILFKTAAEIVANQPTKPVFVAAFYLALSVITEIVGKAKVAGKSTFLSHLIGAVLSGRPFLGLPTKKSPVVWLTEERAATFIEVLKRGGLAQAKDLHVLHWHEAQGVPFSVLMDAAIAKCAEVKADVLIVDTVSQFAGLGGDSENNAGDAMAALQPLQRAAAANLAVVAVRHERKGGGEVGESGRGSSAFVGGVDIHIAVRRPEGNSRPTLRVLKALSRFTETPEELVIDLTADGYVPLGTESSVAVLEAKQVITAQLPGVEAEAADLDTICDYTTPAMKRTNVQRALKELPGVQRLGKGKKGDPHRWFRTMNVSAQTPISRVGRKNQEAIQ